ncbi:MAG TPA: ABC transporter ATP-binding protein [Candidatus Methylomirabilis sp.]|nr:ABC transporter ATP-binding protein [Candidatus Methylomirabilis sp.]
MASDRPALVEVQNLVKHFPVRGGLLGGGGTAAVRAVDGITFEIGSGETVGLVGESGCGKTTTGRMIMKLIPPTSGDVLFEGRSIGSLSFEQERAYRRQVQMVFQDPFSSLNPRMTVGNIIGYPMRIQNAYPGPARDRRIRELLELVGLSRYQASWYPHEFSGGERQRVGIATALALDPKFVFCDEPVSSLDVSAQAQILNLLKDIRSELDLTILMVTHNLSVVEYLSDRVVVMYLGKIVEIAATADLYRETLHPYSKALVSAIPTPDPDVEREREQIILRGEIPSPLSPPSGCRFHTRCQAYIGDVCRDIEPALREVRPCHFVACHLYPEHAAAPVAGSVC